MKFTFLVFFLMFVLFSTEKTRKWTLPHESSQTDTEVNLPTQEQRAEITKEKLNALEERLQEYRAQNLQKLEQRFHKREQIIKFELKRQKKQEVIQIQKKIQKYRQFEQEQSIYPNRSNLCNRLSERKWSEFSEKERNEPTKIKMTVRKLSNAKSSGSIKIYPNQSSIKVFYDVEANVVSWEDPDNLVPNEIKKSIELSSQQNGKAEMSNCLFDCIFDWYTYHIPKEANPFVRELLFSASDYVDIERRDQSNRTPLFYAAGFNAEKVVVKLVGRGANTEAVDHEGRTALHYATGNGNFLSCKTLLQKGANVNAQNKNGKTPLMWAALYIHLQIFKLLLDSGANTEIKSTRGETAFQLASPNWANVITAYKANLKINKAKFKI